MVDVLEGKALGKLHIKPLRCKTCFPEGCAYDLGNVCLIKVDSGKVYGHGDGCKSHILPSLVPAASLVKHEMAYLCDKHGLFRHGDKVAGWNHSAVGLYPADKSLHTRKHTRVEVDLRLIIKHKLVVVDSSRKLFFDSVALDDLIMYLSVIADDISLSSVRM